MSEKITIYRGTDGDYKPVRCTCEKRGYPNDCVLEDGTTERQYDNTHFGTEAEAWGNILQSVHAGVRLSGSALAKARDELRKREVMAAECAELYAKAHDAHLSWKLDNKQTDKDPTP